MKADAKAKRVAKLVKEWDVFDMCHLREALSEKQKYCLLFLLADEASSRQDIYKSDAYALCSVVNYAYTQYCEKRWEEEPCPKCMFYKRFACCQYCDKDNSNFMEASQNDQQPTSNKQ